LATVDVVSQLLWPIQATGGPLAQAGWLGSQLSGIWPRSTFYSNHCWNCCYNCCKEKVAAAITAAMTDSQQFINELNSFCTSHTWSDTVWSAGRMDGVGGGYDKCMYVEPPGEVDTNYKHIHTYSTTFTSFVSWLHHQQ